MSTDVNQQALLDAQQALEEEAQALGFQAYQQHREKAEKRSEETRLMPHRALERRTISSVITHIEGLRAAALKGRRPLWHGLIKEVPTSALAVHGLRRMLASTTIDRDYRGMCVDVGKHLLEDIRYTMWSKSDDPEIKKLYSRCQIKLKQQSSAQRRRQIMRRYFDQFAAAVELPDWTDSEILRVGSFIVEAVVDSTGLWKDTLLRRANGKRMRVLRPTDKLLNWINDTHERVGLMQPVRMPMIVRPVEWDADLEGGYLSDLGGRVDFIRGGYRSSANQTDRVSPETLAAVNHIQATPWRVNQGILNVAEAVWALGGDMAGMPPADSIALPEFPAEWEGRAEEIKEQQPEQWGQWVSKRRAIHESNANQISKRISVSTMIRMARRFGEYDAMYYPHCVDFRGRIYPVPSCGGMHPQGPDLGKALLQFSEAKPLGQEGVWWLFFHTANLWGKDKLPLEERIEWVEDNLDLILDSAMSPMDGERFWMAADKPWQALACAYEVLGWHIMGDAYESRLPIAVDGSCNGLQHYAAMLRCPSSAEAVNVAPTERHEDVYQKVADAVSSVVHTHAVQNDEFALLWDGHITRKLVKQPVMTTPYGVTARGMQGQIMDQLRKLDEAGDGWIPKVLQVRAASWLAKLVYEAVTAVVTSAPLAMDWLRDVAQAAGKAGHHLHWTTPVGFKVVQDYRAPVGEDVWIHSNGQRTKVLLTKPGDTLDKGRQRRGAPPNFIHSYDSAHLMLTINTASDEQPGMSWAAVHDSYGTHACDMSLLSAALRETFAEIYSGNVLEEFWQGELKQQLPDEVFVEIPSPPSQGSFDPATVIESRYFFA